MPQSCVEGVRQAVDKRKITVLVAKSEVLDDGNFGRDRLAKDLGPGPSEGAFVVFEVAEVSGHDGEDAFKNAGSAQALHHAVEVVVVFVEVFEGEDAAA